jgi:thiol-disulfide isomerase/thioredoxin
VTRAATLGAAAAALLLLAPLPGRAALRVGDLFPPLASSGLGAKPLPETAGSVVLVDFWASWCAPCRASFPAYSRLNAEFAPKGLVIIAVGVDRDPAAYEAFVKKEGPVFFVALDRDQKLVSAVGIPTMPTSYLLDRQGRVRFIHPGFHDPGTEALLRSEIETLLAAKAS